MTFSKNSFLKLFLIAFVAMCFVQCAEEEIQPNDPDNPNDSAKTGMVNMQMTDAPIDNASIEGVFVTIAEVRIDGEVYDGLRGRHSIDVMSYQNGAVKALGLSELEVGSYSNISLVLDYETDVDGNAPGCYILTTDGLKESLESANEDIESIDINTDFEVIEDGQTDLVIDFDLRKTITGEATNNDQWDYSFVTEAELDAGLRVVKELETGAIIGTCTESLPTFDSDKIVVFAYKEGTYNAEVEMQGQGSSNIEFANAVTSASVDSEGNYQLSFLQEGEYELVFISYEDNGSGSFSIEGQLDLNVDLGIDLQTVQVSAMSSTTVNVNVTGILP